MAIGLSFSRSLVAVGILRKCYPISLYVSMAWACGYGTVYKRTMHVLGLDKCPFAV